MGKKYRKSVRQELIEGCLPAFSKSSNLSENVLTANRSTLMEIDGIRMAQSRQQSATTVATLRSYKSELFGEAPVKVAEDKQCTKASEDRHDPIRKHQIAPQRWLTDPEHVSSARLPTSRTWGSECCSCRRGHLISSDIVV